MRVLGLFLILMMVTSVAMAQGTAIEVPKTCDAEFHDVLRSKAWMEAQREVEVAEEIILSPDSILMYSCFKDYAKDFAKASVFGENLSKHIDDLFSGVPMNCVNMENIWKIVRCSDADKGRFFKDLAELKDTDTRSCSAENKGNRDQDWTEAYEKLFPQSQSGVRPVDEGGYDPVDPFLKEMIGQCSETLHIETGVLLDEPKVTDAVCLAPGCYADGGSCK